VSSSQRRYLLLEQGIGSGVINFGLNAAIGWLMFRGMEHVPLWGQQSIMADTLGTCFMLPFMTALMVTPIARRHVRRGKVTALGWTLTSHPMLGRLPRGTAARGAALGLGCLVALAPLTLLALSAFDVAHMSMSRFVLFKASFAAVAGLLVTPLIALWAIAERPAG
jgi:hypothetical protein